MLFDDILIHFPGIERCISLVEFEPLAGVVNKALAAHEKAAIPLADFSPMERAFVYILFGCGLRRGEAV